MSLTPLAHRKGVGVVPASNSPFHILDAVYTALTAANDYNGVAFPSPLVGVTKTTVGGPITEEVIHGTFTTSGKTYKFMIAAASTAKTPAMFGNHTWLANCIMTGGNINSGVYLDWAHGTTPMTGGTPTGFMRTLDTATTTCVKVYATITAEKVDIDYETNTGLILTSSIGAILDPETASLVSAESDGRVYGVMVSGSSAVMAATQNTATGTGSPYRYLSSNGGAHFAVHVPGTTNLWRGNRSDFSVISTPTSDANADNEPQAWAIRCHETVGSKGIGRLREVCVTRDAKYGLRAQIAGVDKWYYLAGATGVDQDALARLC